MFAEVLICDGCEEPDRGAEVVARRGWDLVTSRRLTEDQGRRADELARVELGHKGGKPRRKERAES